MVFSCSSTSVVLILIARRPTFVHPDTLANKTCRVSTHNVIAPTKQNRINNLAAFAEVYLPLCKAWKHNVRVSIVMSIQHKKRIELTPIPMRAEQFQVLTPSVRCVSWVHKCIWHRQNDLECEYQCQLIVSASLFAEPIMLLSFSRDEPSTSKVHCDYRPRTKLVQFW